jgi:hypothetical protein
MASVTTSGSAGIALILRHLLGIVWLELDYFGVDVGSGITGVLWIVIYEIIARIPGHKPTVAHAKREHNHYSPICTFRTASYGCTRRIVNGASAGLRAPSRARRSHTVALPDRRCAL